MLADELGNGAVGLACDVRDTTALTRALDQLPELVGGAPDIIVNNAGAFALAPASETSVEAFAELVAVNLTAPFAVVRTLLPALHRRGAGHVVTIGSIVDRAIFPGNAAYASSKHGVRALHEVLRAELKGSGIRASLVSPGPVDTGLWDSIDPDSKPGFTPRSEMLTPAHVADAVLYVVTTPPELNIDELRLSRT
jgi:NADP-dependent 3-hydroxy acid dehydrogenase YdfG